MKKHTYIQIPDEVMDYIEGLSYLSEGYKQILRHLGSQKENINYELIQEFTKEYESHFIELKMAINETCKEFVPEEMLVNHIIKPNFGLGALVIMNTEECNCENCIL